MADRARLNAQWRVGWALFFIGLVSLPMHFMLYSIPTVRAVWSQLNWLVDTGLVMLCLYAAYARRLHALGPVLAVLLVKGLVFSAITGHAGWIFLNGTFLACVAFLSARFSFSHAASLVVAGVIALFPVQMWLKGRGQLRSAIRQGAPLEERIGIAVRIFSGDQSPRTSKQDLVSVYRGRGDYSDLLAAALAHTPAVEPYAMGETYWHALTALVPRLFWPTKPFTAGGNEFVSRYTGITFDRNTSIATNYLFELYVNFGTTGVIAGMFLFGLALAWMESLYYVKALGNLFYEYCVITCSWSVCLYSDKIAEVAMTVPPTIAMCVLVHPLLRLHIHSRYLPHIMQRPIMATPVTTDA
jgi:hypothetical protein